MVSPDGDTKPVSVSVPVNSPEVILLAHLFSVASVAFTGFSCEIFLDTKQVGLPRTLDGAKQSLHQ